MPPKTKICLGAGVLCKMFLFNLKESMEELIEFVKNMNIHHAHKKYTGKFAILCLNSVEKIIVNKAIINRGLKKVQKIPKMESLYFDVKFFLTISSNKNNSFLFNKLIKPTLFFYIN